MQYEDWQVKPWTTNFLVVRILVPGGYSYRVCVGQWVDEWWGKFRASLPTAP